MMLYAGGSDGTVKRLDVGTSAIDVVGRHSRGSSSSSSSPPAASCLSSLGDGDDAGSSSSSSSSLLASAGWDKKLHVWDVRVGGGGGGDGGGGGSRPVASADLPGKAFGMDASRDGRMIVVAASGRRNCFFDIRRLPSSASTSSTSPEEEEGGGGGDDSAAIVEVELLADRESSLKYQTRCVRFFGSQESSVVGIAVGSIEGRVAIEYMDDLGVKSNGGEWWWCGLVSFGPPLASGDAARRVRLAGRNSDSESSNHCLVDGHILFFPPHMSFLRSIISFLCIAKNSKKTAPTFNHHSPSATNDPRGTAK